MTYDFVQLPSFSCIGLERVDLLSDCRQWLPDLWALTMPRLSEILPLRPQGRWGLMSDTEIFLAPWGGERGRYLASWEVPQGTQPFGDWKVWEIPGLNWMRMPCRIDQIGEALEFARASLRLHPQWCWEGSVHEFYPPRYRHPQTDELCLMMGIQER